jgi:hypothetical protein
MIIVLLSKFHHNVANTKNAIEIDNMIGMAGVHNNSAVFEDWRPSILGLGENKYNIMKIMLKVAAAVTTFFALPSSDSIRMLNGASSLSACDSSSITTSSLNAAGNPHSSSGSFSPPHQNCM